MSRRSVPHSSRLRHRPVRPSRLPCLSGVPGDPGGGLGVGRVGAFVIDTLRLTAEEAVALIERARSLRPSSTARTSTRRRSETTSCTPTSAPSRTAPTATRRPDRAQGRDLDEGRRDDRGLEDPRGLPPGLRRDRRRPLQGGRPAAARQDQHGRVRDGLVDRELGVRADAKPMGPDPRPGRLLRRLDRGGRGRARAVGARLRHRRLDQAARRALRGRRPAPDLRHGLPLRDRRLRVEPRPDRPDREDRPRLRAPLPRSSPAATLATRRRSSCPSRSSSPTRRT